MQLLSSVCLHFMHITLPSSVYGLRFLLFFFGFLFLSPESGEIFNEALEGLHCSTGQPRQLLTSLAETTTTSRAAAASRSGGKVPFQLELFFPDQSKSKVHKPIDMSNNNLASLPYRVCTVIYTFTSSLPSEFFAQLSVVSLANHHPHLLSFVLHFVLFLLLIPSKEG